MLRAVRLVDCEAARECAAEIRANLLDILCC